MIQSDPWRSQELIDAEEEEDRLENERFDPLKIIREARDLSPEQKRRLRRTVSDRTTRLNSLLTSTELARQADRERAVRAAKKASIRSSKSFDSSSFASSSGGSKMAPGIIESNNPMGRPTSASGALTKRKFDSLSSDETGAKQITEPAQPATECVHGAIESSSPKRRRVDRTPSPTPNPALPTLTRIPVQSEQKAYSREAPRRSPRNKAPVIDLTQNSPAVEESSHAVTNVSRKEKPTKRAPVSVPRKTDALPEASSFAATTSPKRKRELDSTTVRADADEVDSQATTASHISDQETGPFAEYEDKSGVLWEQSPKQANARAEPMPPLKRRKSSEEALKDSTESKKSVTPAAAGRRGRFAEKPPTALRSKTAPMTEIEPHDAPQLTRANTTGSKKAAKVAERKSAGPKKGRGKKEIEPQRPKSNILKGLVLFHIPTTYRDTKLRRQRVAFAEAHGAKVVHNLSPQVTHIIADMKGMTYEQVRNNMGSLEEPKDPPDYVHLVEWEFAYKCVDKKRVLDPRQELGLDVPGHRVWLNKKKAEAEAAQKAIESATCHRQSSEELPQEIADSQPSPQAPSRDTVRMPPPPSPASLEIKADTRRQRAPSTPIRTRSPQSRPSLFMPQGVSEIRGPWHISETKHQRRKREAHDRARKQSEEPMETPQTTPTKPRDDSDEENYLPIPMMSNSELNGNVSSSNTLEQAIEEAKSTSCLSFDAHNETDENSQHSEQFKKARRLAAQGSRVDFKTFGCMQPIDTVDPNGGENADVVEKLQAMLEVYERRKDQWRTLSYRRAISALRKLPYRITTVEQAKKLPRVGESLAQQILEIVNGNELKRLQYAKQDKDDQVLQTFMQIYGAGLVQAQKWKAAGFRNLDDLRKRAKLTVNQQVGLDHYDDFLARIPRDEVHVHETLVRDALAEISDELDMTVMGSYRRGASTCGDIDYLITPKGSSMTDTELHDLIFGRLIPRLKVSGYITATLAEPSTEGGAKLHGAAIVPGKFGEVWRRVDFLMVPYRELGAALIYFTGDDIFNRSIRLLASRKNMRLNQHGLYENVMRGPGREKITEGTLVESRSERKIFEILGVPYRVPKDRVIR